MDQGYWMQDTGCRMQDTSNKHFIKKFAHFAFFVALREIDTRTMDTGFKMQDDFLRILKSTLRTLLSLQLCVKHKELL